MKVEWIKALTASAVVAIGLLTAGCSTHAKRVDCEWRLKPINPPTPLSAPAAPSKGAAGKR